jgi:hypothetical protein
MLVLTPISSASVPKYLLNFKKNAVFWDVTPCVSCKGRRFGRQEQSRGHHVKGQQRHIRLEHPDNSAAAEHNIGQGHRIQLLNASILAMIARYMDRMVVVVSVYHGSFPLAS